MYLKDLLSSLRRRWYVVVAGLLVTVGLAVAVLQVVPVTYTTTTSLLLLPPRASLGARGNPYLNLSNLGQALDVLATSVNAGQTAQDVARSHPDTTVKIGPDGTTTGPILLISVTDKDPTTAVAIRDQMVNNVPAVLVTMQDGFGVQPNSRITTSMIAQDPEPEREIKDPLRAVIFVAGLGVALTVLGTGYLDYILDKRAGGPNRAERRRREAERLRRARESAFAQLSDPDAVGAARVAGSSQVVTGPVDDEPSTASADVTPGSDSSSSDLADDSGAGDDRHHDVIATARARD